MPEAPTSVREALHAAAEPDKAPPAAAQPPTPKEPETGWQPENAQERQIAERFGKSVEKMDVEERKDFIKKIVESDRKIQDVTQSASGLRKFAQQLTELFPNIKAEEVVEAMTAHRSHKSSVEKTMRGIDALIEKSTDPAVREELRESKRIMHEEFEDRLKSAVEDAVKELRQEVADLKSAGLSERSSVVEAEIDALSEEEGLPESFVEKYREAIREAAVKYRLPVLEVLPKVVPYADLKAALAEVKPPASDNNASPPAGTRAPAPVSTSSGKSDISTFKDKKGVWDVRGALKKLAGL